MIQKTEPDTTVKTVIIYGWDKRRRRKRRKRSASI